MVKHNLGHIQPTAVLTKEFCMEFAVNRDYPEMPQIVTEYVNPSCTLLTQFYQGKLFESKLGVIVEISSILRLSCHLWLLEN